MNLYSTGQALRKINEGLPADKHIKINALQKYASRHHIGEIIGNSRVFTIADIKQLRARDRKPGRKAGKE